MSAKPKQRGARNFMWSPVLKSEAFYRTSPGPRVRRPTPRRGCKAWGHQVEPDPAEMVARYGADTPVLDWRDQLVCFRVPWSASGHGRDRNRAAIGTAE